MIPTSACFLVTINVAVDAEIRPLFGAIRAVETAGMATPDQAVGDGGRSIGPYQISYAYWADSGVLGKWTWCRDRAYSEAVISAYWKRHCPDSLRRRDFQVLARVHNGGPNGNTKIATLMYWQRVRQVLMTKMRPATPRLVRT